MNEPKWKRFERVIANLQGTLSPHAEVTLNDKIDGRRSGVKRQIDVSVRETIGQFEILVVIDCKDYSDPVDVKDVEEFIGLVEDVAANKSAMVAANGFTETAKRRAKDAGVDVYTLVDAEDQDWGTYVAIPVVCDFRGFGRFRFIIGGSNATLAQLYLQDPKLIPIFDVTGNQLGTPLTLLWAMWNRREISEEPGIRKILIEPNPIFVKTASGELDLIEIIGEFEVLQKLYLGNLPLTKIRGLRDENSGNIIVPNNSEIITDWIDSVEVETHWQRIPSIEVLAVKPFMVTTAFDWYPSEVPDNKI